MKRISLLAIVCSLTFANASRTMNLHPAVQEELKKCLAHGVLLVQSMSQNMQDANELEKTRKNAKAAVLLATAPDQKRIAETEKARFFAALKKEQTKVDNPQLTENFLNALKQTVLIFVATAKEAAAKQNERVIYINDIPMPGIQK